MERTSLAISPLSSLSLLYRYRPPFSHFLFGFGFCGFLIWELGAIEVCVKIQNRGPEQETPALWALGVGS